MSIAAIDPSRLAAIAWMLRNKPRIRMSRPLPDLTFSRLLEVAASHKGQIPGGNQQDSCRRISLAYFLLV
jgi:hypothetical protein